MSGQLRRLLHSANFPWLPEDPSQAWTVLRRRDDLPDQSRGKAAKAIEDSIRQLIADYNQTGVIDPRLRNFYAERGVPFDTLAKFEAGELPMDAASRAARARQMGIDPEMQWTRHDWIGLDRPREGYRGNLVYAGFTPELADAAAVSKGQAYPLIGPSDILGLEPVDAKRVNVPISERDMTGGFDRDITLSEKDGLHRAWRLQNSFEALNELADRAPGAAARLRELAKDAFRSEDPNRITPLIDPRYGWSEDWGRAAPNWKKFETTREPGNDLLTPEEGRGSRLAHERAMEAGARGSLVGDEAQVSVAFFGPNDLRHADLALLDPDKKGTPGYMRAVVPAAIAAGAAGSASASETFPVLTPEELAQLRQEFPNMPAELSRQFEQASQFVGEGISADGVEFTPGTGQRSDGIARARPRSYAENDRKQAIANMDGAGKARMDRYYAAVTDAMQQPVISVRAAADMAAERLGNPELAQAISDRLAMSYESGLMSPADYLKEVAVQPFLSKIDELREQGANIPDSLVEAQVGVFAEQAARHAQTAADFLGQRDMHPENAGPAIVVRQAVMDHAPRGKYAAYGHRTYSENAQVPKDKGDPNYYMTPEGAQNHQALRVAELFSANDEGYAPAAGFSQAIRMVTPFVTDGERAVKEFVQTGSLPYISEGTPGGKFDYASDLYARGAQGDRQQVYAEDGTPKYYAYDPTQQMGLGNAFMNTSFPYARAMNNTAPVREVAMHAGEAIEGRDYTQTVENLRRLRRESKAITPLVPDGLDPKQHRELGEKLDTADSRMDGWMSAFAGPKFADAQNAVFGTKTPRTYLSPAMDTLLNVPAESFSDPINLGVNLTIPAIGGSLTGGVKGAVKGLAKSPLRMLDDAVEESAENMALGPATTGIAGFFMPEEDNLMMRGWKFDGRQGGPNDPGYDQEVEKRAVQARQDQMDAADEYGKARSKARYDSKPRPIAEVRW